MEKNYNHENIEEKWYAFWLEKGYFKPSEDSTKKPFSIVIPPPNVTGSLHIGHAFDSTLQDILIRWKRMSGYRALWLPGTDHAGIATQNVVERHLSGEGLDRHKLGRDTFIERIWKWKAEYGDKITNQLKKLGASCDWSRERFTMDEGLSLAVREVFVKLFEEGLIYRDNRLINWCPRCRTALSDLEVEHEELDGALTYIKYPLSGCGKFITVATTRPETMLGDTAVAVHPDDKRYSDLTGQTVDLPLTGRKIPVIPDLQVDKAFGTGAVKVTPAHDFNDEAIAKRQSPPLPFIEVIGSDGFMTPGAGDKYAGLDRYECRKRVIQDLQALGLIEKEEKHRYAIGSCYRCKTIIEPLPTLQWYVNIQPLSKEAIKAVRKKRIRILPEFWENTYFVWMENIKDWCISRQIWWGHRIPVWYCRETGNNLCRTKNGVIVSRTTPDKCPYCGSGQLAQDEDVLDTWFSSALWPFSTFGWPGKTDDLKAFYPTSVLVTGNDILFFWVARMVMMGLKFMNDVPFHDVYIHALIRDTSGQKMSKSKGNVVNPLIMIDKYGADAFRFALAAFAQQGRDIKFSEARVEGYRHFINKLWNATRFIMINTETDGAPPPDTLRTFEHLRDSGLLQKSLAGRWILSRLAATVDEVNRSLSDYRFNDAVSCIYQFVWHEFCDWYIEISKEYLYAESEDKTTAVSILIHVLETTLRLLHPFMPHVTEEIWQHINHMTGGSGGKTESIMIAQYPEAFPGDPEAEGEMAYIIDAVTGIRNIRGELNISPSARLNVLIRTLSEDKASSALTAGLHYIKRLARADEIRIGPDIVKPKGSATSVKSSFEIYVPLKGLLNIKSEIDRLIKERDKARETIAFIHKKLMNQDFMTKAPGNVIEKTKAEYNELATKENSLEENINKLKSLEGGE